MTRFSTKMTRLRVISVAVSVPRTQSPAQFRCSSALLAAAAAFIDPTSGREPRPEPITAARHRHQDMQHTQQGGHRYYVNVCNLWDSCHWF